MHVNSETLALLALGEPVATADELSHLADCDSCAAELDAFAAAANTGRSTASAPTLVAPPERVWQRIQATLHEDVSPPAAPTPLTRVRQRTSRPARVRWLALAAAIVLAATLGGVVTALVVRSPGDSVPSAAAVIADAQLAALPSWPGATGNAKVEQSGDTRSMVISISGATTAPDSFREVWLINSDLTKLVSLGLLSTDSGTFAIPANIDMSEYTVVDVSSQPLNGNPAHSANSIVRGSLSS